MSAAKHSRSTCGASEHRWSESAVGSIGSTRVGKYTDVARSCAPVSTALPGTHVVAHVRDRDDEAEALRMRLGVDRVVEVARILAIDGDERQVAQVDARRGRARIDVRTEGVRLAQRRGRETRAAGRSARWPTRSPAPPGGPGPRRFATTACAGDRRACVARDACAMTQSPPRAPFRSAGATAQRSCSRRSAAFTQALRPWISTVPRNAVTPRSSTSSTRSRPALGRIRARPSRAADRHA